MAEHRPLVLQTGALGPLDNSQVSFTGFRVLSVQHDVFDKIHFASTEKLEASGYRLAWDEALGPEPGRRDQNVERSRRFDAPATAGEPSGIVFPAIDVTNVVYRDAHGQLHEVWQRGADSGTSNLSQLADNAIRAAGDPTSYIDTTGGMEVALYRGIDGHVHGLYWSTGRWAGTPSAAPWARHRRPGSRWESWRWTEHQHRRQHRRLPGPPTVTSTRGTGRPRALATTTCAAGRG